MQIAITSTGVAILLFLCAFLGFQQGLRLGIQTAKGQIPPKITPVKSIKEAIILPKPDPATAEMLKGSHVDASPYLLTIILDS
jgi:hypothetical protein